MALLLLTVFPAAALGQDPAVDQYVESVPGAEGHRPPDRSSGGGPGPPPQVEQEPRTAGAQDAGPLETVISSPALGAPQSRKSGAAATPRSDLKKAESAPSAFNAAASAATSGDGGAWSWLVAGIALLSAAVAAAVVARRRSA